MKSLVFFALCIATTLAWWQNGHMLTAQVAKLDLLQRHPEVYPYAEDMALLIAPFTFNLSNSFIESAVWADDIKNLGWGFWSPWHFINRGYDPSGEFYDAESESDSPWAINQTVVVLTNNLSLANVTLEKSIMLRMMIHIIGDMHQPLHNAEFYSELFPTGDQGGNLINVTWEGEQTELHAFWDSVAEELGQTFDRPLNESSLQFFEQYGLGLMHDFPRSQFPTQLNETTAWNQWTFEVYEQAVTYAYDLLPADDDISSTYQKVAYQVCRANLALGGYRLADMIWYTLGNQIPPSYANDPRIQQYINKAEAATPENHDVEGIAFHGITE
jgi:hypothetical protein